MSRMWVGAEAILCSGQYSRVLGWVGVTGTIGWFLAGSALFLQLPGASFQLMLPFVAVATAWVVGLGIALVRRGAPRLDS